MFARARVDFERFDYPLGLGYLERSHGDIEFSEGRYTGAHEKYEAYLAYATRENHVWSIAEAHARLAWTFARLEQIDQARRSIAGTLRIAVRWSEAYLEILALLGEAYCIVFEGDLDRAAELAAWIYTHPCTWNEVVDHAGALLDELGADRPAIPAEYAQDQLEGVDVRERTRSWLEEHPTHEQKGVI
jgi:hypothetical protein